MENIQYSINCIAIKKILEGKKFKLLCSPMCQVSGYLHSHSGLTQHIVVPLGPATQWCNHEVFSNGGARMTNNSNYHLQVQMKSNDFFI